jgi:dihydrolipoamide dehydrogenase
VLVAVGRRPNSKIPGLDGTRVRVSERGFILVDDQMRTDEPSIFAIGDVVGEPMLAHKASHEGRVAVEVMAGENVAFAPRAIPAVVFTDPELAWCGLTEAQAQKDGREVAIARFPWAASGRAITLDRTDGVTKLVLDPGSGRLLGVGLVGSGAGELIAEGVLAIEMGANATDLRLSVHPHPTLTETVMEAAEVFFGQATHVYRPKR